MPYGPYLLGTYLTLLELSCGVCARVSGGRNDESEKKSGPAHFPFTSHLARYRGTKQLFRQGKVDLRKASQLLLITLP